MEDRGDIRAEYIRRQPLLPPPWTWIVDEGQDLALELKRETVDEQVPSKQEVIPLARRTDCDEVLEHQIESETATHMRAWAPQVR
jgi:hypothetical protein